MYEKILFEKVVCNSSPVVGYRIAGINIAAQMAARGNGYYAKECVTHNMLLRSIPLNFAVFIFICLFLVFRP
jgi:hypothetical protein